MFGLGELASPHHHGHHRRRSGGGTRSFLEDDSDEVLVLSQDELDAMLANLQPTFHTWTPPASSPALSGPCCGAIPCQNMRALGCPEEEGWPLYLARKVAPLAIGFLLGRALVRAGRRR